MQKAPRHLISIGADVMTAMTKYQDTLDDVKATLGILPGFMKAPPEEVLIHDWPLFKKYSAEQTATPQQVS